MILPYENFKEIMDNFILIKSKADLLISLSNKKPKEYYFFRYKNVKAELIQRIIQSHEIRFGDAFEKIIEKYLALKEFEILPKRYFTNDDEMLNIDQCFKNKQQVFFIEQKVRDDHDSTKKRGQIQNFEKKLHSLSNEYKSSKITGIFYFIDSELVKNKNYYTAELAKMSKAYGIETHLFYGKPLFDFLQISDVWEEILTHLEKWKKEIPDLPEINFDLESDATFEEIKEIKPLYFRKLFENDDIFNEIVLTLFPEKKTLKLLLNYFTENSSTKIYKTLAELLKKKLNG